MLILCLLAVANSLCNCDADHYCSLNYCISCTPYRIQLYTTTPAWGQIVGKASYVPAYSNKDDEQVLDPAKDKFLEPAESGLNERVYLGQSFQCVQFARYYWIMNYGCAFESINAANEIFGLAEARDYVSNKQRKLTSFANGGLTYPQNGDLLIWEKVPGDYPAGHVAVIVGVDYLSTQKKIYIAEQNYQNFWDSSSYSRALKVSVSAKGEITVINQRAVDEGINKCRDYPGDDEAKILGWVRLQSESLSQ